MTKADDRRLDALRSKRQQRQSTEIADWQNADATLVLRAVAAVSYRGGALRLGYTRDGGAYAIGIYLSNDSYTEYLRPGDDLDQYFRALIEDMETWGEGQASK